MLETYVAGLSLLTTVFFEAIAVSWIYGTKPIPTISLYLSDHNKHICMSCTRNMYIYLIVAWLLVTYLGLTDFKRDINKMLGHTPNIYWRVCWKIVSPSFLFVSNQYLVYNCVLSFKTNLTKCTRLENMCNNF